MGLINRKACSLLLFLTLLLLMIPTAAFASNSDLPATLDLKAGSETVGNVVVEADGTGIKATYTITQNAYTPDNKDGLVLKDVYFKAWDNNNKDQGHHETFKTVDALDDSQLHTSTTFHMDISNLKSFTTTARLARIQKLPVNHTLSLLSGTGDNVGLGGANGQYVDPVTAWTSTSIGSASIISDLRPSNGAPKAEWIWKTAQVTYPVTGEIYDYTRDIVLADNAYDIQGQLKIVCDNAYIAKMNSTYISYYGFDTTQYLTRANLSTDGTDLDKEDRCFANLSNVGSNGPNFIESVVHTASWSTADPHYTAATPYYAVSGWQAGHNTFEVKAMNEYMNGDDTLGDGKTYQKEGTVDSNPAGLLYRLTVSYSTPYTEGDNYTTTGEWTQPDQVYYTVNFVTYGGTPVPADQIVKAGATANRPSPNPARNSDSFSGWYTEPYPNYGQEFDFDTRIYHDTTVYARWTSNDPGGESFPIFGALPSFFEIFGN